MGKEPSIIVKDLKVGGKNIALRDAGGTPIWLGRAPATPATPVPGQMIRDSRPRLSSRNL